MTKNRYLIIVCLIVFCLPANAQYLGWALRAEYETISDFNEGIASAKKNGKWGYVSDRGKEILAPAYDVAYPFNEGMGVLASNDLSLLAILDRTGKLIPITEKFQIDSRFATFSDGLLLVAKGKKKGYLNKEGLLSIDCKYDIAQPFSEGLAAAVLDIRQCYCWYYIDMKGRAVFHLSELKKDVYWALGFRKGKALVLHGKGALFINPEGRELKELPPQITAPEDALSYTKETLACREGILSFDTQCRALSFVAKNGKKTEFSTVSSSTSFFKPEYPVNINGKKLADEDMRWLNPSTAVVKISNSKFGMLTVYDTPVLAFSFSSDTLASVFGNSVALDLNVKNTSPDILNKVDIQVNEEKFQTSSLISGGTVSYTLPLKKITENEIESKDISITAWDEGLKIGESKKTVWIKDIPSLNISIPTDKIIIQLGQSSYLLKIKLINLSDIAVHNVVVSIDQQSQTIALLDRSETTTVQFSFSSPKTSTVKSLIISAKSPNTPPVTVNGKITIEVPLPPPPTF